MTRKTKVLVCVFALATLVACLLAWIAMRGEPPLDDRDLMPMRTEVSYSENAFFILNPTAISIYWPNNREREIAKLLDAENGDPAPVEDLVTKNSESLALFDEALARAALQIPEPKSFEEDYRYLSDWKRLGQLAPFRSFALFHRGKHEEAFDAALQVVRFGHQIEDCGGPIIHYLMGSAVKAMGLAQIRRMARTTSLAPEELGAYIKKLDAYRANEAGLSNAFKVEYRRAVKNFEDISAGRMPGTNSALAQAAVSMGTKPFLSLRKTKARLAQISRVCLTSVPLHKADMPPAEMPQRPTNSSPVQLLMRGNAIGEILVGMLTPAWDRLFAKKCQENASVTATQLLLALKCYHSERGSLPQSLDELVPKYFAAVPLDDFDGKPFRYLPDKKLLYSVGDDLEDSKGQEMNAKKKPLDLPFKIEFEANNSSPLQFV